MIETSAVELEASAALKTYQRAGTALPHESSRSLVARMADNLISLPYRTWFFGDSVAFEAMVSASEYLGDERWASFAHGWARAWATRATPYTRMDCTLPGAVLVKLAQRFNDRDLLIALISVANYLASRSRWQGVFEAFEAAPLMEPYGGKPLSPRESELLKQPPPGVFVDCLHFDPPFFTRLGLTIGDEQFVDLGLEQALGYIDLLQNESGLFDHFALRNVEGSFGGGWGRGQGWALLGLLDVIESLREFGRTIPPVLLSSVERLLHAMVQLQQADGHWPIIITEPDSGHEFSTAAFMAVGFSRALHLGVGDVRDLEGSRRLARDAVLGSLDQDGHLTAVSAAVYASTELSHYANVPRGVVVPWGEGPALLTLVSW